MTTAEPATQDYVQSKIDSHESRCQAAIQARMGDLRADIGRLFDAQTKITAGIAAVDERTKQHEGILMRVEQRQNESNRWAVATMVGIAVTLMGVIFTLMKEFIK